MRKIALAIPLLALGACTIPSFSSLTGNPELQTKVEAFCAADFVTGNVAALNEWVMVYNLVAPLIDREPIVGDFTANETVRTLMSVRSTLCLATAPEPAPEVLKAI
jgi:hypothetical protein